MRRLLLHFTHIANLTSIVRYGLHSDEILKGTQLAVTEVGNQNIKWKRRNRRVPAPARGVVADYVPFYFAAQSPMLYAIYMRNVPTYTGGQDELVYLVTNTEEVLKHPWPVIFTDRNATSSKARYGTDLTHLDSYVDWELMAGPRWCNTLEEPNRKQKRMAELLVYCHVPWAAIIGVATRTERRSRQAAAVLAATGATTGVRVIPEWYFR